MSVEDITVTIGGKEVTFPNDRDTLYLRWANGNYDAAQVILLIGTSCQVADDIVDERQMPDPSGKMLDLLWQGSHVPERS